MGKRDKLIQKILDEKTVTYQEAEKILLEFGYTMRTPKGGSSHVTFTKKASNKVITLVKTQKPLKTYAIRLVKEAILNE